MTEPNPNPPVPSQGSTAGGNPPVPSGGNPPAVSRPEGLPEQFWDTQANGVKLPELVSAFGEASKFKADHDARIAALPKKAEDYKIEIKLPDTVKLPEGFKPEINDKDPRIPAVREFALKHGLSQDTVTELIALDAVAQLEAAKAADAAIQAEFKKLGENGKARVDAVKAFLKANLTAEEASEVSLFVGNATALAGLEKIIAKAVTQSVPGNQNPNPPNPAPKSHAERIWPNGFGSAQPAVRNS